MASDTNSNGYYCATCGLRYECECDCETFGCECMTGMIEEEIEDAHYCEGARDIKAHPYVYELKELLDALRFAEKIESLTERQQEILKALTTKKE